MSRPLLHLFAGSLLLLLFTAIVYLPVFSADVILDDEKFYVEDPVMEASDGLFRIWFRPLENNGMWPYIPITRSTFWIERQLVGLDIQMSHAINVMLHGLMAILLWGLLKHWGWQWAWWTAVIFALHPVYVQSVAWVAERKNIMSGIFFLLSLWAYRRFTQKRAGRWYLLTLLMFVGALFSKTSTIMLPIVFLLLHWGWNASWKRSDILYFLPFFALSGGMAYSRVWFEANSFGANAIQYPYDLGERFLIAGHVPFFYLQKFFFPYPLIFTYPKWTIDASQLSQYLPLLSIPLVLVILLWKAPSWGKGLLIGLSIYGVLLFPVLGLFNNSWFQYSFVTDHWLHLPSLPLLVLLIHGLRKGMGALSQRMIAPSLAGIAGVLGILTFHQTPMYENHQTLWTQTLHQNPNSWVAQYNLGTIYMNQNRFEESLEHLQRAVELYPLSHSAYNNRAKVYIHLGDYEKAIADYTQILRTNLKDPVVYNNRGTAYFNMGKFWLALADYDVAIHLDPQYAQAYTNRGNVYMELQQYVQAFDDYTLALQNDPKSHQAYNYRGTLFLALQQPQKALEDFQMALHLKGNYAEAHHNQAVALTAQQRYQDALNSYTQAIHHAPQFTPSYVYRGYLWLQHFQRPQQACQDWQQACTLGDCQHAHTARIQQLCP